MMLGESGKPNGEEKEEGEGRNTEGELGVGGSTGSINVNEELRKQVSLPWQ